MILNPARKTFLINSLGIQNETKYEQRKQYIIKAHTYNNIK